MDLVPLHRALITELPRITDVWKLTDPTNPVAVVGWGQPTLDESNGYLVIAAECRSALSALAWMTEALTSPSVATNFPGWVGPFAHVVALEREGNRHLGVVGWSAKAKEATYGRLTKPPHPEFELGVDLVRVSANAVVASRRDLTLTLISNLGHLHPLMAGLV